MSELHAEPTKLRKLRELIAEGEKNWPRCTHGAMFGQPCEDCNGIAGMP